MEEWLKIVLGVPAFIAVALTLPYLFMKSRLEVKKLRLEVDALYERNEKNKRQEIFEEKIADSPIIFFSKLAIYTGFFVLISIFFFGIYIRAISVTLYIAVLMATVFGATVSATDTFVFYSIWQVYRRRKNRKR